MNGKKSRKRGLTIFFVVILAIFFAGWITYSIIGHRLITAMYNNTAPGFLRGIIAGQDIHSLQHYLSLADRVVQSAIAGFLYLAGILLVFFVITRLIVGSPRCRWLAKYTDIIDNLPDRRIGWWIVLAAGAGLFLELMIIRLHASYFQLFAYFKNVSLLSCFLGLGIGYSRGEKKPLTTPLVFPFLAAQILLMYAISFSPLVKHFNNPISEQLTMGIGQAEIEHIAIVYLFIFFIFFFNMLCFIPLGHLVSRLMLRRSNLVAYSWNLVGSLAGILLFSLLSFFWLPPGIWILVGTAMLIPFLKQDIRAAVPTVGAMVILLAVIAFPARVNRYDVYSPYQKLSLTLYRDSPPVVEANNTYHQRMWDLREEGITESWQTSASNYYSLPYRFKPEPRDVLIVGSGTGNDVAAALRQGAGSVDAVEIDPAIIEFGIRLHPEEPYQAENVEIFVNDARPFIRSIGKKYDLIVYGFLDSHTLLSGRSGGIRLDSFIYTVEAFREARRKLKDGGMISLSFATINPGLGRKLYIMLAEAFDGVSPKVYQAGYDAGYTFIIGEGGTPPRLPGGEGSFAVKDVTAVFEDSSIRADKSTDNWPFFYMPVKKYPVSYLVLLGFLLAVSIAYIRNLVPGASGVFSFPCFFLGAGFMLIETKGITELALVYGSTWLVISIVIIAILIMAFLANLSVIKWGTPSRLATYGLLTASVAIGIVFTFIDRSGMAIGLNRLLTIVILVLPLFFSGFAFSTELKKNISVAAALSSNLFGAMLGGILEYNSMYLGFRSLYYFALVIYLLAFVSSLSARSGKAG